jgi:hypothetical protein
MVTRPDGSTVTVVLLPPTTLTVMIVVWLAVPKGVKIAAPPLSATLFAGRKVPAASVLGPVQTAPAHVAL